MLEITDYVEKRYRTRVNPSATRGEIVRFINKVVKKGRKLEDHEKIPIFLSKKRHVKKLPPKADHYFFDGYVVVVAKPVVKTIYEARYLEDTLGTRDEQDAHDLFEDGFVSFLDSLLIFDLYQKGHKFYCSGHLKELQKDEFERVFFVKNNNETKFLIDCVSIDIRLELDGKRYKIEDLMGAET